MTEIRIISKDSLEEFLSLYGIFIESEGEKLLITEMYPPLPKKRQGIVIINVNEGNPLKKENWREGINKVGFENGEMGILILKELAWSKIVYETFISKNNLIIQCVNFVNMCVKKFPSHVENIVLDIRFNFGGCIKEMNNYYLWIENILKEYKISNLFILVSNSTCSSAEILVEKLAKMKNCYVIGSETFKKKYVYRLIGDEDKKIFIPEYKINVDIKRHKEVKFYFYYDFFSSNYKRVYDKPDMWRVGDINF